jgi:prepilin-type N-terminal cleavage/methylation domain-containing protein
MFSSLVQRLNDRRAVEFEAEGSAEAGFTLIELMVVLLIMAILLAIAIPAFLGVSKSANERAGQANLNTGLTNAVSTYENQGQSWGLVTATGLTAAEPSLTFQTAGTAATAVGQISVDIGANGIVLAGLGKSGGNCYGIANFNSAAVAPAVTAITTAGTYYATITAGACDATLMEAGTVVWNVQESAGWVA